MASSRQSRRRNDIAATAASAVASLPVPSASPSAGQLTAFKAWQDGPFTPDAATCSIDSDGPDTLTSPIIYGWDSGDASWRAIGVLNEGVDISLTAAVGFEQLLNGVGVFAALAVSAGKGAALVTVKFTPITQVG